MTTPPPALRRFDDTRMEALMGRLLQVGVLLSSAVVLLGGLLYLHAHGDTAVGYHHFSGEPATLRNLHDLRHAIAAGDPASIIQLGILLLIATPIARVILAAVAFAMERDLLYSAISLTVLAVLLFGLIHLA